MTEKQMDKMMLFLGEKLSTYITALIVIAVGIILIKVVLKVAKKALEKSSLDASVYKFILTIIKYSFYVVIIVIVLSVLEVPTAPLITVIGATGAAIALALKDSLSNVAAGILILFKHPFKRGDFVTINGYDGIVDSIEISSTTLKTLDNRRVIIPNAQVMNNAIVNSSSENIRTIDRTIAISYGSDLSAAKEAILSVVSSNKNVLDAPKPFAGTASLGESAVYLDLMCWVETPRYLDTKYALTEEIKTAFNDRGIEIPQPELNIRIDNANTGRQ